MYIFDVNNINMEAIGNKKGVLKSILKQVHQGADIKDLESQAKDVLKNLTPEEISQVEQELIKDGMPRETIQKLCDIHLEVFKDSLDKKDLIVPSWHPVYILIEEHKTLLNLAKNLKETDEEDVITHILHHLRDSDKHYLREENVLFPYLEKHGVTEPPAVMWMEHNKIRDLEKTMYSLFESRNLDKLNDNACILYDTLSNHFYKENNILFPTALKVMEENEWKETRKQFDSIGYCCFTPEVYEMIEKNKEPIEKEQDDTLIFESGKLTKQELTALLNSLPIDITFVDKDDTVRYFSQSEDRIFVRTNAILGRTVQNCHPSKSIDIVNKIVNAFKEGKKNKAEFWLEMNNRLIYIRYLPIRINGDYIGTIEITQDITDIKKIKGQRRLLDWD